MFKIDKSVFDAEELAQYEALIAKAKVDVEAGAEGMEDEMPPFPPKKKASSKPEETPAEDANKSASPELTVALERLEALEKSVEMKAFTEIAKKYAALGEKEDALSQTLYDMKKSNEANYNAYIGILDKSLHLVEKSGLFAEIGKSGYSGSGHGSGAVAKVETIADEIMKSDTSMTREQAVAKAWTDHPELIAEYDAAYKA